MDVGGITPQYETWMNRQEIGGHNTGEDTGGKSTGRLVTGLNLR